jgi:hypothetical protein
MRKVMLALASAAVLAGCYHATVETGLPPSPQTIEKKWASGWIYGLVPPATIETMQRCPNGVARVETQLSFANQLVNFLTLGIYTPMEIVVTCAASGMEDASLVDNAADFAQALKAGTPFWVDLQ